MSGFPFTHLAQQFSLIPPYYSITENGQPVLHPSLYVQPGATSAFQGFEGMQHAMSEYEDPNRALPSAQSGSRSRRRIGASGEQVKFRRTRSGCYTCRNRRVKCDETRPICERCKKGSRDCVYPEPTTKDKIRRSNSKGKADTEDPSSPDSTGAADGDDDHCASSSQAGTESTDHVGQLHSPTQSEQSTPILSRNDGARHSSIDSAVSPIEPTVKSAGRKSSIPSRPRTMSIKVHPDDVQFYLDWALSNLTPYHWSFAPDGSDFLLTTLFEYANRYEPLLYALTCFAAYHHTLNRPDGQIETFLKWHSKSVSALHRSLMSDEPHTVYTLLTILQLATIEESFGDWVSLMSHQKAAYQILTELFTPESIMQERTLRVILKWYLHFDTYVGMLSGTASIIPKEWLRAQYNYYDEQATLNPDNIVGQYERLLAETKVWSYDIFELFGMANAGQLTDAQFEEQAAKFKEKLDRFEYEIHPKLRDESYLVEEFPDAPPLDPNDIVNPYEPGVIYGRELFPTNQCHLGLLSLKSVYEARMATLRGNGSIPESSRKMGWRCAQVVDAIEHYPGSPKGALLAYRAIFALAAFSLPGNDPKIAEWARKKFAAIECQGYIVPDSVRMRISNHFNIDVSEWWLEDPATYPPVVRSIREFIAERSSSARRPGADDKSTQLKEMAGIFKQMSLSDGSSPESVHSPGSSSNVRHTDMSPTTEVSSVATVHEDAKMWHEGEDESTDFDQTWTNADQKWY